MEVDSQNLTEVSYQYIKQQIELNVLTPGTRLVNRKLATELGVSAIPIREAICRLAADGFVEYVQGSGAFVRTISREELDELFVLRDLLESFAAGEAASHITRLQLEDLQTVVAELREITTKISNSKSQHATPTQNVRFLECDAEFHEILLKASRNNLLQKVIMENRAITTVFFALHDHHQYLTTESATITCESKECLIQALTNRDTELSRSIMSQHIQLGRRDTFAILREQEKKKNAR